MTEADRAMNTFVEEGYLQVLLLLLPDLLLLPQRVGGGKKTRIGLGPRFLAELESWLGEEDRPEGVWKCAKCSKVGCRG